MGSVYLGHRIRAVAGGAGTAQDSDPRPADCSQARSSSQPAARRRLWRSRPLAELGASLTERCLRLCSEREVFVRSGGRMRYVSIPSWAQVTGSLAILLVAGWVGFATSHYLLSEAVIQSKDRQARAARAAQQASVGEVQRYRVELAEIGRRLEARGREISGLIGRNGEAAGQPRAAGAEDFALRFGRPGRAGAESGEGPARTVAAVQDLWRGFDRVDQELETVIDSRAALADQRDHLQRQVKELENRLAALRTSQEKVLRRITQSTSNRVVEVEKLIAITGLEVNHLLGRLKETDAAAAAAIPVGRGGPFLELAAAPLHPDDPLTSRVVALDQKMERWHDLQRLLRILPLAAPADQYRFTSGFGRRVDPLRKRWAHHDGVDLANHTGTPVLATAPGTVVFVGWRGNYGRTVDIDHGLGVLTRYSHLKKILVKKGERVEFRDKIGLMGSSGRSTGTHVHYEVRVDDRPLNPIKFMKAGKYVFQGK